MESEGIGVPPGDVTFGTELRRLRQRQGLTLAALAERVKTSKGYLSRLERGLQQPSEAFARACDQALGAGGALLALAVGPGSGQCPYPGLTSFGTEDARWFFGRERAVADLLGLLADPRSAGHPAVVIGPSGIGKSSLLRAGLAAAVARGALPERQPGTPTVLYMTPTALPLGELRSQEERLPLGSYALLIVDQFEELFALCLDEAERVRFIGELCARASDGLPVAIGLRADFYGHCLPHPPLLAALRARALPLGPMRPEDLREAIIEPAAAAGLTLEPGLMEVLLRDLGAVGGTGTCEAGALPLLSHALRVTWQQRVEDTLTVAGYERTGGVHGAVATTAERVYGQQPPNQQGIVRRMLLNLVQVGDGTDTTRHRAGREELIELTAADIGRRGRRRFPGLGHGTQARETVRARSGQGPQGLSVPIRGRREPGRHPACRWRLQQHDPGMGHDRWRSRPPAVLAGDRDGLGTRLQSRPPHARHRRRPRGRARPS
ncbi:hypothetical protein SVIOM74S_02128 [Streptomyces violarus]